MPYIENVKPMHMIYVSFLTMASPVCRDHIWTRSIIISETLSVFVQCYGQSVYYIKDIILFISSLFICEKIYQTSDFSPKTICLIVYAGLY